MLKLARYLKYYKLQVTIGPVFKLLEAVFELIVPLIMANIIDIGVKTAIQTILQNRAFCW